MFQPLLAPANAFPDATRDPLLRRKIQGAEITDVRKGGPWLLLDIQYESRRLFDLSLQHAGGHG